MARDREGNTPLHHAVDNWQNCHSSEIMELLIVNGADPKAINKYGLTPDGLTDMDGNQERHNDVELAIELATKAIKDIANNTQAKKQKTDTSKPAAEPLDEPAVPTKPRGPS